MLEIKQVTMTHATEFTKLVADLSIVIHKGDKVAIIGEEGNGKSSLLKWMMCDKLVSSYLHYTGEIHRQFERYSYIPQQFPQELEPLSLNDYFFNFDDSMLIDYTTLYRYAEELQFDSERFSTQQLLSSLSGGEKLKIQLIKQFAQETDILFLDEPSNDLDLHTLKWLENTIQTSPKTIIFISHDETFLHNTASAIIHLERIKKRQVARTTVQLLSYHTYSQERRKAFDQQLKQARNERLAYQKKMKQHHRIHQSVEYALRHTRDAAAGSLLSKKMKNVLSQKKRYEKEKEVLTEMPCQESPIRLSFKDVHTISGHQPILQLTDFSLQLDQTCLVPPIHFTLMPNEKIGIVGPNGIGKSTFLKTIHTLLKKKEGYLVSYMPQHYPDVLDGALSPIQFLCNSQSSKEVEKMRTHLARLQFSPTETQRTISQLSGGQQAKLLLLKMVCDAYPILLLDEPTRNISPTSQVQIRQLFSDFPGTILCVSHDREFLKHVCHRIYQLDHTGLHEIAKEELFS